MFSSQDLIWIFKWWLSFFLIGIIFLPLTFSVFQNFKDKGYLFSKVIGLGLISYTLLVLNISRILPFNLVTITLLIWVFLLINFQMARKHNLKKHLSEWKLFVSEEILFLAGIFFWSYIRGHEPSINGLEKFMDFGFLNSILRTTYQPAVDMWFPPFPINYYYFGHLTTALITKISFVPSYVSYNLMLSTIFSFTFMLPFSLSMTLLLKFTNLRKSIIGGLLTGALVSLAGNLHTIYSFFVAYNVDHPVPLWKLAFMPLSFPNGYWYPNATRFIPFTIHEFPLYSFVVSDLHGHVVDIIYVLLTLSLVLIFLTKKGIDKFLLVFISLFLAIMYMTNAWDGLIYMLLFSLVIFSKQIYILTPPKKGRRLLVISFSNFKKFLFEGLKYILPTLILFTVFSLPFNLNFKPFASGIGVLCAPDFLGKIGRIGPILFEKNHCQRSDWWQLLTLYGFFYFFVISFILFILRRNKKIKLKLEDLFVALLIFIASLLIIIPEFVYLKDIYPAHYRANTMFKLVYQSFIMLSLASGYIIVRITSGTRNLIFYLLTIILLGAVFLYPYFAIKSYYGDLKTYLGQDGIAYMKQRLPEDYVSINWINKNIKGRPIIVEAQGDSYTDYARISSNTGLPTILGWTVHEWLWRGTYDIPAPRIDDVRKIYESEDVVTTQSLFDKYNVSYVYVGNLEREKYPKIMEEKFKKMGTMVFKYENTRIYKVN